MIWKSRSFRAFWTKKPPFFLVLSRTSLAYPRAGETRPCPIRPPRNSSITEADLCHVYRPIRLLWPIAATSSDNEDGNWDKKWPFSKKLFQIGT